MAEQNQEKKRSQVTLFQVVADKIGVSPGHVSKVAQGLRNNAAITTELNKLNQVIEEFKSEPIKEVA